MYEIPGAGTEVVTTGITDTQFDPATKKLALKASVDAANGTPIDIYTTDDLMAGWTKWKTVVVAGGTVELESLDFSGSSLFISVGKPPAGALAEN